MMQDYMVTRKDVRRVESGSHEKVIKDFRQRMTVRKEQADAGRHMSGILGTACGVLTVAVLAGGVVLVNNYHKMRQMESVLTSVVPAGTANWIITTPQFKMLRVSCFKCITILTRIIT